MTSLFYSIGSTGAGILQIVKQRNEQEIKKLQENCRLLRQETHFYNHQHQQLELQTVQQEINKIEQRIGQLQAICLRPFDTDGTHLYHNYQARNQEAKWDADEFARWTFPGGNLLDEIRRGQHPGRYDIANAKTFKDLQSNMHGAGGSPPNGLLAAVHNQEEVERIVRADLETLTQNRRLFNPTQQDLRIFVVGTGFGGTGSGTFVWLHQLIQSVVQDMGRLVKIYGIFLVPGMNQPKDPDNSLAITFASLKTLGAIATGNYYSRQQSLGNSIKKTELTPYHPILVLSDITSHPNSPQSLTREEQTNTIAEMLFQWTTSPLGLMRDTQALDCQITAQGLANQQWEPKLMITAGLSMIVLGRGRVSDYGSIILAIAALKCILDQQEQHNQENNQEQRKAQVNERAAQWLSQYSLIQGKGEKDLSTHLANRPTTNGVTIIPANVSTGIDRRVGFLPPQILVQRGYAVFTTVVDELLGTMDTWEGVLQQRGATLVQAVEQSLKQLLQENLNDLNFYRQFLERLEQMLDFMLQATAEDNSLYETAIVEAEQNSQEKLQKLNEWLQYQGRLQGDVGYRLMRLANQHQSVDQETQQNLNTAAQHYRSAVKRLVITQMQQSAHLEAHAVLGTVRKQVALYTKQLRNSEEKGNEALTNLENELKNLINYQPKFECPNGLHLHATETDLRNTFRRLLTDQIRDQIVAAIARSLNNKQDLAAVLDRPESWQAHFLEEAQTRLKPHIETLHIIDELCLRYPEEADLGELVMNYGDRCSREFLELKDSVDVQPMKGVRLLGIDTQRAGDLVPIVNKYRHDPRRSAYLTVNTNDPDRIIFWQERHELAYSDWQRYSRAKDAYWQESQKFDFEKFHALSGDRCLIHPGQDILHGTEAKAIIVLAWLLGSIQPIPRDQKKYELYIGCDRPIPLTTALAELSRTHVGYRCSVNVWSRLNCLFYEKGVGYIGDRLESLRRIRDGMVAPVNPLDPMIAPFLTEEVWTLLSDQLDWLDINSIPAAMGHQ